MLELASTRAAVVGVYAAPEALDSLHPAGAYRGRVAPDEAMFVTTPGGAEALVRDASAVTAGDPQAIVLDSTDGWAVWTLIGERAAVAVARLSPLRLAEGFHQGDVARIPTRLVVEPLRIHLFVPAMWGDYLHDRIVARSEGIAERVEPVGWTPPGERSR